VRRKSAKISLASNSDSSGDDGGEPPRKKTRRDTNTVDSTTMQAASNGCVQNGAPSSSNGASENGHEDTSNGPALHLTQTNQDIVRLIGQYLKNEGLTRTADSLMAESGCRLDHPAAAKFRQHVMDGDWTKADHDLQELHSLIGSSSSLMVSKNTFFAKA
jgi:hypothetical protein